jgi:hypothetical protein
MPSAGRNDASAVGLCACCRHGQAQQSAGGSRFWRCLRATREPGYLKYPPLPMRRCPGFDDSVDDTDR